MSAPLMQPGVQELLAELQQLRQALAQSKRDLVESEREQDGLRRRLRTASNRSAPPPAAKPKVRAPHVTPRFDAAGRLELPKFVHRRLKCVVGRNASKLFRHEKGSIVSRGPKHRRTIIGYGVNVHGEFVYLVQTETGRLNLKGVRAGNEEYGPLLARVNVPEVAA